MNIMKIKLKITINFLVAMVVIGGYASIATVDGVS